MKKVTYALLLLVISMFQGRYAVLAQASVDVFAPSLDKGPTKVGAGARQNDVGIHIGNQKYDEPDGFAVRSFHLNRYQRTPLRGNSWNPKN